MGKYADPEPDGGGAVAWGDITGKPSTFAPVAHNNSAHSETYLTSAILASYAPLDSPTFTGTVGGITKAMVGLGNVDNTSDVNKPVSTAQQSALDLKAPIASPVFTTQITTPLIYGGDQSNGDITIEGTSHASKATSYILLQPNGGNVGIGISAPLTRLEVAGSTTNSSIKAGAAEIQSYAVNNNWIADNVYYNGGWIYRADGYAAQLYFNAGDISFWSAPSGLAGAAATMVNRMSIKSDGAVRQPSFTSGWSGTNWQITANGDAELENLIVRGSARFRELIIDQLSVIGGSDLMSIARGKVLSVDVPNSKVTLEDPNARGTSAFAVNDFFWIKNVDIDHNLFSDLRGQITGITGVTLTLSFAVAGANGAIGDVTEGDVIVQRGHPSDTDRQSLIYRTASDTDNPYQRYLGGVDSLAAFDDLANVILQEGNLESLAGHGIVPASPGVGIYSKNAYLSGTLYSSEVSVSGLLSNTVIKGPDIWEDAYNGSSNLYINRLGYQGGTTQFRQTIIGDGKGNDIATFWGQSTGKFIELDANVYITGALRFSGSDSLSYAFEKTPSNNLRNSHDAEVSTVSDTYFKVKTMTLTKGLLGAARINFSMKWVDNGGNGTTAYGRLYRNDNLGGPLQAIGAEQTTASGAYVLKTQDITQIWLPGDKLELWIHTDDDLFQDQVTINNLRILYDDLPIVEVPSSNS